MESLSNRPVGPLAIPGTEVFEREQVATFGLYWTKNYDLFIEDPRNRVAFDANGRAKNVALEASMRKRGYLPAAHIVVTAQQGQNRFRVVEGHNRLAIARAVGERVWFALHPEEHHISPLEYSVSQKAWNFADRARAHAGLGDYSEVLAYCDETGMPERAAFNIFRGEVAVNTNSQNLIDAGLYEIKDRQMPEKIRFAIKQIAQPFAASRNCVGALSKVYLWSQVAFDALVVGFSKYPQLLKAQRTAEDYLDLFERVFNYGRRGGPLPFKTEIDRAMLERQRNFGKKTT